MDKQQKELLKSYLRQRNIGINNDSNSNYLGYEVEYLLNNDLMDYKNLNKKNIMELLIHDFYKYDTLYFHMNENFNIDEIVWMLSKEPKTIVFFKENIPAIEKDGIVNILSKQPQLIKYFKSRLKQLNEMDIVSLLKNQPSLINDLHDYIYILNDYTGYHIARILKIQPELAKYFSSAFDYMKPHIKNKLLDYHPQLKKYFE